MREITTPTLNPKLKSKKKNLVTEAYRYINPTTTPAATIIVNAAPLES